MKTYKHLYPQITALENLRLAFKKAARGKRSRPDVAAFEFDLSTLFPNRVLSLGNARGDAGLEPDFSDAPQPRPRGWKRPLINLLAARVLAGVAASRTSV